MKKREGSENEWAISIGGKGRTLYGMIAGSEKIFYNWDNFKDYMTSDKCEM